MEDKERLFGKWNELVIILISFILTTILGTSLAFYFQKKSFEFEFQKETNQFQKQSSFNAFQEISCLLDDRLYNTRKVYWSYADKMGDAEINARWESYRNTLDVWNKNLNRNLALLETYFGSDLKNEFEKIITGEFREIGKALELMKVTENIDKNIFKKIDDLNVIVYKFDNKLLKIIDYGKNKP